MANELRVAGSMSFNIGGTNAYHVDLALSKSIDVTGVYYTAGVQSIGTSEEQVAQNEIGTPGYVLLKNIDPTNYIQIGCVTGQYSVRLRAGEIALFRMDTATLYAKADTAACVLQYLMIEQ